jgi:MFS family permease
VLVAENFLEAMGHPSVEAQGTMTSVYNLGCFAGALSTLYSGDRLGRPRTLMLGNAVLAIGAIIQAAAYGPAQMYAGRVIAGLGTGMNTATAGVWQSETSKMRSRGKLIIIQMGNCITGFAISNWLTLGFSFLPGSVAWRFPLAFQLGKLSLPCPKFSNANGIMPSLLVSHHGHGTVPTRFAASAHPKRAARGSIGSARGSRRQRRYT